MEIVEQIENLLIVNDEPEFSVSDDTKVSAEFFILRDNSSNLSLGEKSPFKIKPRRTNINAKLIISAIRESFFNISIHPERIQKTPKRKLVRNKYDSNLSCFSFMRYIS